MNQQNPTFTEEELSIIKFALSELEFSPHALEWNNEEWDAAYQLQEKLSSL